MSDELKQIEIETARIKLERDQLELRNKQLTTKIIKRIAIGLLVLAGAAMLAHTVATKINDIFF